MKYASKPGQFKNWPEICLLQDVNMRILISVCQEPAILFKLGEMYPTCFSNQRKTPKIPLSAIMWLSRYHAGEAGFNSVHQDHRSKFYWQQACNTLGLPLERYRRPNTTGTDVNPDGKNAFEQLHGQTPKLGMEITWNGKLYIVAQLEIRIEDINKPISDRWFQDSLMLAPAEQIDRNS